MRVPADEIVCKSLPEACNRTGHIFEQPRRPRIVAVDGGSAALAEQTRLGVAVGFHCTMVVKMVLREIGEHAEREVDRAGTPLHERVGGDLHHHMGAARVRHFAQQTLERQRVGRGALGRQNGVADHVLIGPDQTDLCAQAALKELLEKIRCGRLAVAARHGVNFARTQVEKDFHFARHGNTVCTGLLQLGQQIRHAGRAEQHVFINTFKVVFAADELCAELFQRFAVFAQRRFAALIAHRNGCTVGFKLLNERQIGAPHADKRDALAGKRRVKFVCCHNSELSPLF